MKSIIVEKLSEIGESNQVKNLFAIESGSRAWGFPSPDSDYDVRFIYVHSKEYYLSVDEQRDVIELPINDLLDINGWELRKALRLFKKSNGPLYEWLQSPIVYTQNTE
ncbi:MAG: DNA polymerase beta superfamily protein, partial [Cytophagales bacterium]